MHSRQSSWVWWESKSTEELAVYPRAWQRENGEAVGECAFIPSADVDVRKWWLQRSLGTVYTNKIKRVLMLLFLMMGRRCGGGGHVWVWVPKEAGRGKSGPLRLELTDNVRYPTWALETKLRFVRATHSLTLSQHFSSPMPFMISESLFLFHQ